MLNENGKSRRGFLSCHVVAVFVSAPAVKGLMFDNHVNPLVRSGSYSTVSDAFFAVKGNFLKAEYKVLSVVDDLLIKVKEV